MARKRWMAAFVAGRCRVRSTLIVVICTSIWFAACAAAPPAVTVDDPELVDGRDVYARNCVSCHGADGGGGVGRKLSEGAVVVAYPNIKDQIDFIATGKGSMPSYVGRLTGEQLQAVARYTREVL